MRKKDGDEGTRDRGSTEKSTRQIGMQSDHEIEAEDLQMIELHTVDISDTKTTLASAWMPAYAVNLTT